MALETKRALKIMNTLKDLTPILEITSPDLKGFKESTLRKDCISLAQKSL